MGVGVLVEDNDVALSPVGDDKKKHRNNLEMFSNLSVDIELCAVGLYIENVKSVTCASAKRMEYCHEIMRMCDFELHILWSSEWLSD